MKSIFIALALFISQACVAEELGAPTEPQAVAQEAGQPGTKEEPTLGEVLEPAAKDENDAKVPVPLKAVAAVARTVGYLNALNPIYWLYRGIDAAAEGAGSTRRIINKESDVLQNPKPIWDPEE